MKGPQEREHDPKEGDDAGGKVTPASPALEGDNRPEEPLSETLPAPERSPRDTPHLGERLGHFQVLSYLGEGGMAVVYAAEDQTLRRMVALKVLPHTGNAELRARFLREARA